MVLSLNSRSWVSLQLIFQYSAQIVFSSRLLGYGTGLVLRVQDEIRRDPAIQGSTLCRNFLGNTSVFSPEQVCPCYLCALAMAVTLALESLLWPIPGSSPSITAAIDSSLPVPRFDPFLLPTQVAPICAPCHFLGD